MSSDTSTDDSYEVDVAPLPQRSKTIRIEDEPSAPAFQLNPKVQLLNQHGRVQSLSQPRQLERICPSVETRQLVKMLNNAELPSSATAEAVLGHLRDSFHPIPEFAYQRDKPSHAWDKDDIDPKSWFKLLMELCSDTEKLLRSEPMVLQFDSNPAYVMGDLHGNYKDLMQFAETFWKLGLKLCPARILCLGDYVDRGPHSIETIAYLFAQKLLAPKKISLLRGNHELKDVNGDMDTYGAGSFLAQCRARFGIGKGDELWRAANKCFDQMPVAAVLDKRIFCVHGGVPREAIRKSSFSFRDISAIPKGYVDTDTSEVLLDLLWADPSTNHEEDTVDHDDRFPDGFAPNSTRAGNTCLFGTYAVNQFMKRTGVTHIIRAHQPPNLGISFGKRAQVITVFSSSHYCLDGDTPVTLANGLSMRIRELADCSEVLARGPNGTFVPAPVSAHLNQGQKECRELIFRDGRKLVCTPDHQILTTEGWCRAEALIAGKSQVILGLEGPLYSPADDDPAHLAAFELTVGEITLRMSNPQEIARAHALARILGSLYTDGTAKCHKNSLEGRLILGHTIDAAQAAKDVELVTRKSGTITPPTERDNYYTVGLPAWFLRALSDNQRVRLPIGKRVKQAYNVPAVVTSSNTPLSFVREFLRGLFGGDGSMPVPSKDTTWSTVFFSMSKEEPVRDSINTFYDQLKTVLARFGLVTAWTEDWQNVTNNDTNSAVTPGRVVWSRRLTLKMEELVPFQERIGVCYCAHKQQRLAVAAAFYRAKNYSIKQAQKVAAAFDEMTGLSPAVVSEGQMKRKLLTPMPEAHAKVVKELEKSDVIIDRDVAIPDAHVLRQAILGEDNRTVESLGTRKGPKAREFLTEAHATEFFSARGEEDENGKTKHRKIRYAIPRQLDGFPAWTTTFMGFKPAGVRTVYDITVPTMNNFLAAGITVHNCGGFNSAAVVLVADHKVNVIVTSGAAGNQEETPTKAIKGKKAAKVKEEEEDESEESDEEANGDTKGGKAKKRKNDGFKVPLGPSTKRKPAAVAVPPVPGDDTVRGSALGAVGVKRARRKSGV